MFRVAALFLLINMASSQGAPDRKASVLENAHGIVREILTQMFSQSDATLDEWASDPHKIGKLADGMCIALEDQSLRQLAKNVKAYRASGTPADESKVLTWTYLLEVFQPNSRDDLKQLLARVEVLADKTPDDPTSQKKKREVQAELQQYNQPVPAQIEVSREALICHYIPTLNTPRPTTNAGVTYEVVVGKDGKTKSTKLVTGGELPGWEAAAKRMRYRPFYQLGEPVEIKSLVTFELR